MAFLFVDNLPKMITKSKFLQKIIRTFEILLLSAGLISTLAMIKGSIIVPPYSCEIVFSSILGFWYSIKCCLSSSLYICIFINFTVLLIAVSTTFHHHETDNQHYQIVAPPPPPPPPSAPPLPSTLALISNETLISESIFKEKSIVTYENKVGGEEEDTMEATWKAITGGSGGKKSRNKKIKKSETWDVNIPPSSRKSDRFARVYGVDSDELVGATSPKWRDLRKSETFDGAVAMRLRGGMIRRDPSMSIEEFNEQVEAFIKKFNNDMRLQRQESEMRSWIISKEGSNI